MLDINLNFISFVEVRTVMAYSDMHEDELKKDFACFHVTCNIMYHLLALQFSRIDIVYHVWTF
jgi:hypothetical protein